MLGEYSTAREALLAKKDHDGDVNIEENALEAHDANHEEATTNDNGDLQAALFDDTDNNILPRR